MKRNPAMTTPLDAICRAEAAQVNVQVLPTDQDSQSQSQDVDREDTSAVPGEPPATHLPQHPQQQGDGLRTPIEQPLREQQHRETENEDPEVRHESVV
jgi:hypothetical protein